MKVLHVIGNLGLGGAEKLILDTLPIYNEKGYDVDLLVFNGKDFPFMKALKETKSCKIFSFGTSSIYNPIHIFRLIKYLKKYDIAHVHLFPAQYFVIMAKMLSFSKIKLVLTEHNSTNARMNVLLLNKIDKFLYKFYSKIVCITFEIKQMLIQYTNLEQDKFTVINNGVDLKKIYFAEKFKKNEILKDFSNDDILILQVSRFNKQKNLN